MKLLRFGDMGSEKPGLMDAAGCIRDLSAVMPDIAGESLSADSLVQLGKLDTSALPRVDAASRLGPCVGRVGKLVCIGLNYSDHAAETGMAVPDEPTLFMKATSSICGPDDPIVLPPGAQKTDWEAELAFVIGREARRVDSEDWRDFVAGYCVCNDVSERAMQLEGTGQWVKGKSADSFGPLGPWLVTVDEIPDPNALDIWCEVDTRRYQNGNTRTMIFAIPYLLSYVSRFMSLQPGDVVSTGTPPGVGLGQKPPVYLKAGQTVRLGVAGLGVQTHRVVAADEL
jgi:2-keto-4-pentenoate hydratase/2-oxohepta-3-ene-1,7-dioic acid hydratase in catechol pathway